MLAGQDLNTTAFNLAPVGTGPFRFESLPKGESMTLRANPDYFGGPPGIDRVIYAFVPDENVRAIRLRSGSWMSMASGCRRARRPRWPGRVASR